MLSLGCGGNQEEASVLPNIVYILADDLGYGDLGAYNPDSKIPTPNIDRIASEGIRFTDAHSPSAVCTPTRYGILTGRYAWRTSLKRWVTNGYSTSLIDSTRMTVASLLQAKGYTTAGLGKWHLGLGEGEQTDYSKPLSHGPNSLGFDYYYGIPASLDMVPYVFFENERLVEAPTEHIEKSDFRRNDGGGFYRAGPIAPSFRHEDVLPVLGEKAVEFIEQHASQADPQPFFLYMPLAAPHTPWLPTEPFVGQGGAGPFGDFVTQVDWTVGRVLESLDQLGLSENTLVIFTSDNGAHWLEGDIDKWGHRANLDLRGQKADIWEGGHRIPFVARWPGNIPNGAISEQLTTLTDLLATTAAIIGETLPDNAGEDSYNMLPALLEEKTGVPIREAAVHHSGDGMFAIRQGKWKYIEARGSGGFTRPARIEPEPGEPTGQLYNLEDDPAEQTNLFTDHPEIVERLSTVLESYQTSGRSR